MVKPYLAVVQDMTNAAWIPRPTTSPMLPARASESLTLSTFAVNIRSH
jgi:hypothetical protein